MPFDTVLYQFLETGTSDRRLIGIFQNLRFSGFSLYPLSFFLYSPFNDGNCRTVPASIVGSILCVYVLEFGIVCTFYNILFIHLYIKAVHDCAGRDSTEAELKIVRDHCNGKETCEFIPGDDFFGTNNNSVSCSRLTWMGWKCNGNNNLIIYNLDNFDPPSLPYPM